MKAAQKAFCFLALAVLSAVIAIVLPIVIQSKLEGEIRSSFVLDSDKAKRYPEWVSSSEPAAGHQFLDLYISNITNPYEVLAGAAPKIEELEPLRYRYDTDKFNISWNKDRTIVKYREWIRYVPIGDTEERSKAMVYSINLPFMGLLGKKLDGLYNLKKFYDPIEMLFAHRTAHEISFGYHDEMLQWVHDHLLPDANPHYRGIVVNQTSYADSIVKRGFSRQYTGRGYPNQMRRLVSWNDMASMECCGFGPCGSGSPGGNRHAAWPDTAANNFGGNPGHQFPPNRPLGDDQPLFLEQMFRKLDLINMGGEKEELSGITLLRYRVPPYEFQNSTTNPANAAFNQFGASGLMNISTCEESARVFLSKPHFLDGEPELVTNLTGYTAPTRDADDITLDVEPITGSSMRVHFRVQVNSLIDTVPTFDPVSRRVDFFPDVRFTYTPILWLDRFGAASSDNVNQWHDEVLVAIRAGKGCLWAGIVGVALFTAASVYYAFVWHGASETDSDEEDARLLADDSEARRASAMTRPVQ